MEAAIVGWALTGLAAYAGFHLAYARRIGPVGLRGLQALRVVLERLHVVPFAWTATLVATVLIVHDRTALWPDGSGGGELVFATYETRASEAAPALSFALARGFWLMFQIGIWAVLMWPACARHVGLRPFALFAYAGSLAFLVALVAVDPAEWFGWAVG